MCQLTQRIHFLQLQNNSTVFGFIMEEKPWLRAVVLLCFPP